jgi:hypothetical protein
MRDRELVSRRARWRSEIGLELLMKALIGCAALALLFGGAVPAQAKGCLKGALVGGVAGHYAGRHGVLGAAAGCVIGRHEANKRARMEREGRRQSIDGGAM